MIMCFKDCITDKCKESIVGLDWCEPGQTDGFTQMVTVDPIVALCPAA